MERMRYSPTPSQQKILELTCEGRTIKEIAKELKISPSTVIFQLDMVKCDLQLVRPVSKVFLASMYLRWRNGEKITGWNATPNGN